MSAFGGGVIRRGYAAGRPVSKADIPLVWYQRPNVQRTFFWSAVTIGVGYVISRTAVISDLEQAQVLTQYRNNAIDHSGSDLYKSIRQSEERLRAKNTQ